jgi:hypothetical protein
LPRQFECHCAIAATYIEQFLAGNPAEKSREQLPLKDVGDPAEMARSPPGVRLGQFFPRLGAAHAGFRWILAVPGRVADHDAAARA